MAALDHCDNIADLRRRASEGRQFLYQGLDPEGKVGDYIKLPYCLGLITARGANPVSAMCPQRGK